METRYEYKPLRYYVLAFTLTWIPWAFVIYLSADNPKATFSFVLNIVGLLGPMVMAFFFVYGSKCPALKKDFKDRLINFRRMRPRYLLVTLVAPPLVMGLAICVSLFFGQSSEQFKLSGPIDQLLPLIILAFVLAPTIEELGWRGYGMDSLRAKTGTLRASLWFGLLWALWHAPLVFVAGTYHYELAHMDNALYLANFFVSVVAASVFVSWLYYKHNRSIVAGMLLHSVLNAAAILPAATQVTKCIATGLYLVIAIVIVLAERKLFAEGPRNFIEEA